MKGVHAFDFHEVFNQTLCDCLLPGDQRALDSSIHHPHDEITQSSFCLFVIGMHVICIEHFKNSFSCFLKQGVMDRAVFDWHKVVRACLVHAADQFSVLFAKGELALVAEAEGIFAFTHIADEVALDIAVFEQCFRKQVCFVSGLCLCFHAHQRTAAAFLLAGTDRFPSVRGLFYEPDQLCFCIFFLLIDDFDFRCFIGKYTVAENRHAVMIANAFAVDSHPDKFHFHSVHHNTARLLSVQNVSMP